MKYFAVAIIWVSSSGAIGWACYALDSGGPVFGFAFSFLATAVLCD